MADPVFEHPGPAPNPPHPNEPNAPPHPRDPVPDGGDKPVGDGDEAPPGTRFLQAR